MMLIEHSVDSDWLFNTQSRVLQAYWFIMEIDEKATLNINMPYYRLTKYMLYNIMSVDLRWRRAEGSYRITISANIVLLSYNVVNENLCAQVRLLYRQARIVPYF